MKKIKLMIVDDSVLFRSQIQQALKDCPEIEVVALASNGKIAIEKLQTQEIDILTLDLEMPVLDGMGTLTEMKQLGLKQKVVLFSSQSRAGAIKTLEAMQVGATDFVAKPMPDASTLTPAEKIKQALYPKITSLFPDLSTPAASAPVRSVTKASSIPVIWEAFRPEVLVIASSTGGPNALTEFFSKMSAPVPYPILIAQHMPPVFTASLAERIGKVCGKVAREAVHGEVLVPNQIYVAPGDFHMKLTGTKQKPVISLDQGPQRNFVRPCADHLFETATDIYGRNTLGIVFTGMGRDGATGAQYVKDKNGVILIQSQETCVVFGMPGAVHELGAYDYTGSPDQLAMKVCTISKAKGGLNVA
ncbi:MAG: chemotaxis-specific protein-glutamate methyltransferase CheB [Bacteriovoracia bacterium]